MHIFGPFSAAAIAHGFATDAQAARLAGLGEPRNEPREPRSAPTPLWDESLLDRLTQPLSRLRD